MIGGVVPILVCLIGVCYGAPAFQYNGTRNRLQFNEHNAHLVNMPVNLVYEGHSYNQFYISKNGFIMFTKDKAAVDYIAQDWSADTVSYFIDIPFIAPYYFEAEPLEVLKGYTGMVHYQQLTNSSGNGQDLQTLGQYISSLIIGGKQFNPTWGIVVSWENVTSQDIIQQGTCAATTGAANPCPVNSFQLVLLSDGAVSYAIINYLQMNIPAGKYDQAGFNGGNGIGFYNVLSPSIGVDQLISLQSSDVQGRYVFDISARSIIRGGHDTDGTDGGGRSCLSCSGVEGLGACSHFIRCKASEVCYMHHYTTESGRDNYDFGCSLKQVCPAPSVVFVGKRAEGHHSLCYACCNDTNLCNQNLQCNTVSPQQVTNLPAECSDIVTNTNGSGVYTIYPYGVQERPVQVSCKFDENGRGWTVIQQRVNGSVNFYRDWDSYKQGFGSPYGEYWLGNDIIHLLTSGSHHELMINMSDFDGVEKYAAHSTFHVGNEANGYSLYVSGYSGDAGDSLTHSSGYKFSTYDQENDVGNTRDCAEVYRGAWWFKDCMWCDLNGEYLYGHHIEKAM